LTFPRSLVLPPQWGMHTSPSLGAGRLAAIWVKRSHGGVMEPHPSGTLTPGRGLTGGVRGSSRRQVTLLSADHWRELTAALPGPPDPAIRRANLLLDGIDLRHSRGRVLRVGGARVRILGETRPCQQMEEACEGLLAALSPPWGGGAFGEVVDGGEVAVGDVVAWDALDGVAATSR
jgi:MOSC domain-containing protein YiiM